MIKKIADVRGLVTTTVLNTIFKEIDNIKPDVSRLVKKIDHDAKISDIWKNILLLLIITNLQTKNWWKDKKKKKKLAGQFDIFNLVKNSDLNIKLETLATKAELKAE